MSPYLRVSTARQAEHGVSIPDQRKQGETYCLSRGLDLVDTLVEAGASATNDRRPEFRRMIEAGTSKPVPFDVVVVHSFSRFFRDHFELEFYVRKLAGRWGIGTVHRLLTRPTYVGRHEFNKRGKTKELKPAIEVIAVEVPAIIDQSMFDAVQAHLKSRSPKVAHPQIVGGPTLLTGLIHCGKCGGAMTIRHRQGRALSLLHLLDEGAAGRDRLRGHDCGNGAAGRSCRQSSGRTAA